MADLPNKGKTHSTRFSPEETFKKAIELHQQGDVFQALDLYNLIAERSPENPKADIAKTLIAGLQKEQLNIFWDIASEARAKCNAEEALKIYQLIREEFSGTTEAKNADTEFMVASEILGIWTEAITLQSQGHEARALDLYQKIGDRFPHTPEAENAGILIALMHQNRFMPERQQAFHDSRRETPAQIISHLLSHKKAFSASANLPPELRNQEILNRKIEKLWTQSAAFEKDGNRDAASTLYKQIIETSATGHRVRDAKYRLEKIRAFDDFVLSHAAVTQPRPLERGINSLFRNFSVKKLILAVGILAVIAGAFALRRAHQPPSWTEVVQNAKKSVVVVKTPDAAGSGFLVSPDGTIFTNARLVGKNSEVEVKLYSGELKKAALIKVGVDLLDVAVLKIDGVQYPYLPLAVPEECAEGEEIRAIGAASGLEYFVTKGIISHCNQERDGVRYIQTDASINLGSSGGPCINKRGNAVGLLTSIMPDQTPSVNLLLPAALVRDFLDGKLAAVEERFIKRKEEKEKELEQEKKKLFADAETVYKRLQNASDREYAAYLEKLDNLRRSKVITYDQGKLMIDQVRYAPSGSAAIPEWIQSLTLKVVEGEISEDDAIGLIKNHYKL